MISILRIFEQTFAGLIGPLKLLKNQRELIRQLLKIDIANRTTGTVLGWLWVILQPAFQVMAFWFLLDFVLRARSAGQIPYVEYFLIGMLPWLFIGDALSRSLNVLSEFGPLFQKNLFPVGVLPLMPLVMGLCIYVPIYIVVAGVLVGFAGIGKAIVIMLGLMVMLVPCAYLLAVLGLFVRESRQVFPFLLTMLMYITPILFSPDMLPEDARWLLRVNPMADVMAIIQSWMHPNSAPVDAAHFRTPVLLWVMMLAPAWVIFHRSEPHMREML